MEKYQKSKNKIVYVTDPAIVRKSLEESAKTIEEEIRKLEEAKKVTWEMLRQEVIY